MLRRIIILIAVAAGLLAGGSPAADATCDPGRISIKPLVVKLPDCTPPEGGGPT